MTTCKKLDGVGDLEPCETPLMIKSVGERKIMQAWNVIIQFHALNSWVDATPILIIGHKLNVHKILQWRQSVYVFICGKGKDDYLLSIAKEPEIHHVTCEYPIWSGLFCHF